MKSHKNFGAIPVQSLAGAAIVAALLAGGLAFAETVNLNPIKDNTIYEGQRGGGNPDNYEDNSCGAGTHVFSGFTDENFARRALLKFDIAGNIPAGATINSAVLTLQVNRERDGSDRIYTIRPILKDWGEGMVNCDSNGGGGRGDTANPGDATWLDAKHQQIGWDTPGGGGDFGPASASTVIPDGQSETGVWDSSVAGNAAMVTDLTGWLNTPAGNNGWIVIGDETATKSARRFSSRQGSSPPVLSVDFTPPADTFACCFAEGDCIVLTTASCVAQGGTPDTNETACSVNPCPQPVGACCNVDESCTDSVARDACEAGGGIFQGGASACPIVQDNCGLAPFVDALPIPVPLTPTGTRPDGVTRYQVNVQTATQQLHSQLAPTALWTYNGAYPSFTIEARVGEPVEVTYNNNLPPTHQFAVDECAHGPNYFSNSSRIVTHLHGGHVPARFDGQPEFTILPGETDVYEYPNDQLPATMWYHDHALGTTRLNVYAGMAGFYLLRDDVEDGLGLPSGEFEVPIVIQDRKFNADSSLFYPSNFVNGFFGDKILANGKVWPFLNVKQGKYRLRLLNGSQAREYVLRLENLADAGQSIPFTLIGTDLGLITAPVNQNEIKMAPGERFDVIVDFTGFPAGAEIVLRNDDPQLPRLFNVMKFKVLGETGFTGGIPATLRSVTPIPEGEATINRWFRLEQVGEICAGNEWLVRTLDGPLGTPTGDELWDDLSEFPQLGTTEIWEFENPSNMMHPMHIHLVAFQVLSRTDMGGNPLSLELHEQNTWKDTVRVGPGERVRVIARFEDYPGRFAYHCHLLDHEDHEMMRQFQAVNDPANCDNDGFCEAGEDSVSCATDCAVVSGASCGNGLCEVGDGEDCVSCAADCAGEQTGGAGDYCCGSSGTNPIGCGIDAIDNRCIDGAAQRFCRSAPRLPASCGDQLCEGAETAASCPQDCSVPFCEATEVTNEVSCGDTVDNDCDGNIDLADTDCQPDSDSDGVPDAVDNCTVVANGPLLPDAGGFSQRDTNGDGLGNVCDPDLDNNGSVDFGDLPALRASFFAQQGDPNYNADADIDGDGAVNFADLPTFQQFFFGPPGPGAP